MAGSIRSKIKLSAAVLAAIADVSVPELSVFTDEQMVAIEACRAAGLSANKTHGILVRHCGFIGGRTAYRLREIRMKEANGK